MKRLLIFMAILLALACSGNSGDNGVGSGVHDCGVTAKDPDRFGYLTCTNSQPQILECPDYCPGVAPACVTRCLDTVKKVPDGPLWNCPCDGNSCWRVVASALRFCPGCGDGARDGAEECDDMDLGGATCQAMGCTGGTPSCTASCTLSYTTCTGCP